MEASLSFKTPNDGKHYYFGYYDKSPLSKDQKKLLALQVDFIDRIPDATDSAVIGYFDLENDNQFVELTSTRTFNWQQGCMLQWLGPGHNTKIIFNDLVDGMFQTVIFDIAHMKKRVLPMAVYSVLPNGKKALCIDNERHHWCRRGYSYDGVSKQEKNKNIVPGDGIFLLDIETGALDKIITIEQMNAIQPVGTMNEGANYLEHLMVSPSGEKFAFLHRWKNFGGIYARLYVANIDGTGIKMLNDSGRMSHFCWKNDKEILGWGGLKNPINMLRRYKSFAQYIIKPLMPLYRLLAKGDSVEGSTTLSRVTSGDSYVVFNVNNGKKHRVFAQELNKDGHPSVSPTNEKVFCTDTYPGSDHTCQLLLANFETSAVSEIARLGSIAEYDNSPLRCDLHPKWSFCGEYICVDTMHDGVRGMFLFNVNMERSS